LTERPLVYLLSIPLEVRRGALRFNLDRRGRVQCV
jgi:hypothetical protein